MKPIAAIRPHLVALALLAASSAASAQVTVSANTSHTFSNQFNRVETFPDATGPKVTIDGTTYWTEPSLTHADNLASVTRGTAVSTANSKASGVLSGTPMEAIFKTSSWASAASDNRFASTSGGTIRAKVEAIIDNTIRFNVGQLSNYTWSAMFSNEYSGNANSSSLPYFQILMGGTVIFGCEGFGPCLGGSGLLQPGDYELTWGGSSSSESNDQSGATGTKFGSAWFKQDGELKVTAVPEPESYALMMAGLAVLGRVAARRKRRSA
jgi:hypothetical protein